MTAGVNERALVRKIGWRVLPFILFSYFVAMVDRGNISFAAATMNADLGFSETVYGLGASAFFLGYSLLEVPSNLMLARFGARIWLARIMLTWGVISILTAFIQTPWQFYAMRFALGVAEAGFYPGAILYLSTWFPGEHRAWAISRFYVSLPLSYVVMGSIAAPLLALHGMAGLHGWQWLLIVEGMPSVLLALVLIAALPDQPGTARWLTLAERCWLEDRLAREAAAAGALSHHVLRALLNPFVVMLGAANALNYVAINAIAFSAPKLLAAGTGMDVAGVGRVVSAGGLAIALGLLIVGPLAGKTVARTLMAYSGFMGLAAAGLSVLWLAASPTSTIAGYILFFAAAQTAGMLPLAVVSRLIPERDRPAGLAMANTISQGVAFFGPLTWGVLADATGSYRLGVALLIPLSLGAAGMAQVARLRARTVRAG
ncbi:MFS transporter [Novosphingobium fuchskuhlense]|uniref:MFS transporter n=1 Tax=Novosphingobium fuchskuhlense TaxID=1117702 RepID=UPI0009E9E607|nr:MFS transporter [Novosphingobium fuchskuhlense]